MKLKTSATRAILQKKKKKRTFWPNTSDKGLISKIYKELNIRKIRNPIKKWVKPLLFNTVLEVLATTIRQDREKKASKLERRK